MMTALMIFLGLSTCMSFFIVAGVAMGARRGIPAGDMPSVADSVSGTEMARPATFVAAFSRA